MKCPRCQHENRSQAKFCEECGTPLARSCPKCGSALSPSGKFCPECGHPVGGASEAPPRLPAPDTYTPKHLAEKILTSKSALEGERKQVTVLFADLKGSMELLADRDPEEARKLLDPVLERMMEAVHRYEGTVNQVMGDGIMALFGAPLAHEDHAVRACYAALRMQESVRGYGDERQRAGGIPVQIRVGLNSGEVVVRSVGSDLRMDYTAVGQTTHLAARMEQLAKPGSILLTLSTLRLVEGYVQVRSLGPIPVKGLNEPVEAYEIVGVEPVRKRLDAAAARGLTRFVGRRTEVEMLTGALEKARSGRGQLVALVGEPGVGMSRLIREFVHSDRTPGWLLLEGGSASYGKTTAYFPVIDLLKRYFGIEPRDDTRQIQEKVTTKLPTVDTALGPTFAAFVALLEAPVDDAAWTALAPPQRRQRTLDGIKRLLLRESQAQPVLLVFEDLHWIDTETQALLDSLIDSLPTARILLIVTYRPEYAHGWGRKTNYTQLRVDPLPPDGADELLRGLLGDDESHGPLKQFLIQRTGGNPFFLEESVRALAETGVLQGERGAYQMVRSIGSIQVPATVQAVLAARIDRLSPEEKHVLQSAAVIGTEVPVALLQAVVDVPEEELGRSVANLQTAEFLYETRLFPEMEYTFKHPLTHEVAYAGLLHERRRAIHAQIVAAVEVLYRDRLGDQIDRLADHAFRGEVWDKAVGYYRQAGARAMARSAYHEAVAAFEHALEAVGHLPGRRDTTEQAIDLRLNLRTSLLALGELERTLGHLRVAETLAQTLGDERRLGRVSSFLSNHRYLLGNPEGAIESGERALAIAESVRDAELQSVARLYLGQAHCARGDYRQATAILRNNVRPLEADLVPERISMAGLPVASRTWLAWSLAALGEFPEALARGEEAVQIAEMLGRPGSVVVAYFGVGLAYLYKGEAHAVRPRHERALQLCRIGGFPLLVPVVGAQLGWARVLAGDVADGLPLLEQAVEQALAMKLMVFTSLWVIWLGEACLLAERVEDAMRHAAQAVELAREHGERGHEGWALRLRAEVARRHEGPEIDTADQQYRRALALATDLGMRPLVAHCHLGLGKLYRRTGDQAKTEEHLATATAMYREMGMNFWLEKPETALGPPHRNSP